MTTKKSYKLGRYKILEGPGGGLCWESHAGIGSAQTGRCFIEGSILIIGPTETEKSGYLKREFMEHLDRLPLWEKTKYYCMSNMIIRRCRFIRMGRFFKESIIKDWQMTFRS